MCPCFSPESCLTTFPLVHVHQSKFWEFLEDKPSYHFRLFVLSFFFLSLSLFLFSLSFCCPVVVNFPLWKKSFQNKIRIWYLSYFLLVHLSTFTPLNGLLQNHVLFESFLSLPFQWNTHRGLGTNAWFARLSGAQCNMVENSSPRKKRGISCQLGWKNPRSWKMMTKVLKQRI